MSTTPTLLPSLFELDGGILLRRVGGRAGPRRCARRSSATHLKPDQMVFVGVVDPIDPRIETPEEVRDRVLEAAEYIPARTARHVRRLRVLAILRRYDDDPRHGVCENPGARRRHAARRRMLGGWLVADDADEDERLRDVALQNAQSILVARRRAEEELRKQSEWLRTTLASIGDAVITTDADGRVTFLNAVAEALTDWSQAEALGQLPA